MRGVPQDGTVRWNDRLERWELCSEADVAMSAQGPPTPTPSVAELRPASSEAPVGLARPVVPEGEERPSVPAYPTEAPPVPPPRVRRSTALVAAFALGAVVAVVLGALVYGVLGRG